MSIPHDFDCPICIESMTDPVSTPCGHTFCKSCLSAHITTNAHYGAVSCPTCRSQIQSSTAMLHVNIALRDMILRSSVASEDQPFMNAPSFINAPCSISVCHSPAPADKYMVHCTITPPVNGSRQPIVALLSLDLSGSMGTSLPNPTGEKGAKLFTRLDLAKHVCVTTAHMLSDQDTLCIIGFSSNSSVVLKATLMTAEGKKKAEQSIKSLVANGGTNIWSALQLMNKIANKTEFTGCNIVSALLTDGETNPDTSPRRGEVETYMSMTRPEKLSVFGFSYEINSKLLYQLASVSNCTFGFIPDFSMVGTVFINWMATALSTASLERTIVITYTDGSTSIHKTGLIQFGQPRNIVCMSDSAPVSASLDSVMVSSNALETLSPMGNARFELLNLLQFCIGHEGCGVDYTSLYRKNASSSDLQVRELMRDIKPAGTDDEGQVSMAIRPTCWQKWGKHYTRAYYTAVLQETCINFKDPGLQIYGGKLFQDISEAGDTIFRELPAPEATGGTDMAYASPVVASRSHVSAARSVTEFFSQPGVRRGEVASAATSPPATMAAFHNAGGGCWAPGTIVRMADNSHKLIENISKGDLVWTPDGASLVEHLLVLGRASSTQLMCHYKKQLWITPWHPVLNDKTWLQPAQTDSYADTVMPIVYNMILEKGHIIDVNSILSVTLGHGFKGAVIEHSFFGDKVAVLRDLKDQPGFAEGRPVFKNLKTTNDLTTGCIIGWYDAC